MHGNEDPTQPKKRVKPLKNIYERYCNQIKWENETFIIYVFIYFYCGKIVLVLLC